MSRLMSLEDNLAEPGSTMLPAMPMLGAQAAQQAVVRPMRMVVTPTVTCGGCGRCQSCRNSGIGPQAQQPINITITNAPTVTASPTLNANPSYTSNPALNASPSYTSNPAIDLNPSLTSNPQLTASPTIDAPVPLGGQHSIIPATREGQPSIVAPPQQPAAIERIIERPVFIDRVVETIREIAKPVLMPIERIVRQFVDRPVFMPVRYNVAVDRPVPMPVRRDVAVDRPVPMPVRRDVPVDRPVPMPVRRDVPVDRIVPVPVAAQRVKPPKPPQPFTIATNNKNEETDINWWT